MARAERQYADLSKPIRAFTFTVDATEAGMRIDALLRAHYPWHSRNFYQRKLKGGEVQVNGVVAKASIRPRQGDAVTIGLGLAEDVPEQETADDLRVLYEDEHLIAVDKPTGMTCHPAGRIRHGTLINKLHAHMAGTPGQVPRLGHRLDQDTSGVVLCVKHREADVALGAQFTQREVQKTYLGLADGVIEADEGIINAPLGAMPDAETKLHQAVRADGLSAQSSWEVLDRFARHTWVALEPHTGRTHQLRVHMAHIGHPLVADHLYGDVRPLRMHEAFVLTRLALHAHRLELRHPITRDPLVIESPVPADLQGALDALRAAGGAAR
jgi:23S rRNA pseudouridine1911/1915/1917 synthase